MIALLAFVLTDRPLFEFGFNWLSFSNDDLANYTNAAERFMRAGYFQLPPHASMTDLLSSVDIAYWHLYAMAGERAGSVTRGGCVVDPDEVDHHLVGHRDALPCQRHPQRCPWQR